MSRPINRLWILLGTVSGLAAPASSQALSLDDVTLTSTATDVVITVRADDTLAAPSIRSYEGELRVRFPATRVAHTIQVPGDGRAISQIDVRGGSHDSAVLKLALGDETKLAEGDLRIDTHKNTVVIKIARDLLPPMKEGKPAASVTDKHAQATPASTTATTTALVSSAPSPAAKPVAAAPSATTSTTTSAVPTATVSAQTKPLASALAPTESPLPALLAVSAVLALAYAAMRIFMKRRPEIASSPTIEVVAQKRLGARHQLVIVRAFGQDHLLSIQGTTTTHIAASETGSEHLTMDQATRLVSMPRESVVSEKQREAPTPRNDAPANEETVFGGELLKLAIAQRKRDNTLVTRTVERKSTQQTSDAPAPKPEEQVLSQAVAGLVRLRRETR